MSVLALGILLPFGVGAVPSRAIAILEDTAAGAPAKHLTFIHGSSRETVETRATTVDRFLSERGIVPQPEDRVKSIPDATLVDGSTVIYRPAVNVGLVIDGKERSVRSPAATVGEFLAEQKVALGQRDRLSPNPSTEIGSDSVVTVNRVTSWLTRVRSTITPPVRRKYDIAMAPGTHRVVDPGTSGTKETTIAMLQPDAAVPPRPHFIAARILRTPRTKIIAEGVGDGTALTEIANRGFVGTVRLANAALRMVATAYTAGCSGCSGTTATGRPAGHGVVAVDPRVIPLGSHLFIPGYGHALAGDTGGAIRGNRIDLGFDTHRAALTFGRRPIVVYLLR